MDFLRVVPSVWDETRVMDGKVGEYVLLARRRGPDWFIGAMNNDAPRTLSVDLSFLGAGSCGGNGQTAEVAPGDVHTTLPTVHTGSGCYDLDETADGANADRNAMDYRRTRRSIDSQARACRRRTPCCRPSILRDSQAVSLHCRPTSDATCRPTGRRD